MIQWPKVSNTLVLANQAGEVTFGNTLGYFDPNRYEIKGLLLIRSVWIIFISHRFESVWALAYLQEELNVNSFSGYRLSSSHLEEQPSQDEVFG